MEPPSKRRALLYGGLVALGIALGGFYLYYRYRKSSDEVKALEAKTSRKATPQGFAFVNIREPWNPDLLTRFYNEVMTNAFTEQDELEPLSSMMEKMDPARRASLHPMDYIQNIIIAIDEESEEEEETLAGGVAFEYYKQSNMGLITYVVVEEPYRRQGVGRALIDKAIELSNQVAMEYAGRPCQLIVTETHATGVEDKEMLSTDRHKFWQRQGFGALLFEFTQPPLEPTMDPVYKLILLCHELSPALRRRSGGDDGEADIKAVKAFLADYCHACVGYESSKKEYEEALWWTHMMAKLKGRKEIGWTKKLPWPKSHEPPPGVFKFKQLAREAGLD